MGRKHSRVAGTYRRPQTSKMERHRLTNQELTDLLARHEAANLRDRDGIGR